jgi:hypothetical protein
MDLQVPTLALPRQQVLNVAFSIVYLVLIETFDVIMYAKN